MKPRTFYLYVFVLSFIVGAILGAARANGSDVCPEQGKIEAQGNELDDIVLADGTEVCIKGGTKLVTVTADGTSSLKELLGNFNNNGKLRSVSHYTILSVLPPSTTTTLLGTTTTTFSDGPTTTTIETTTTTIEDTTTTTEVRQPPCVETKDCDEQTTTTTTNETETTTTTTSSTSSSSTTETGTPTCQEDDPCWDCGTMGNRVCGELPYTGPFGFALKLGAALLLVVAGASLVVRGRR